MRDEWPLANGDAGPVAGTTAGKQAGGSDVPQARHGRLRRRDGVRPVLRLIGAAIAVVLVATVGVVAIAASRIAANFGPGIELPGGADGAAAPGVGPIEGAVSFLLVGYDDGGGDAKFGIREAHLNDVTILVRLNEDHTHATVVSFPRDMMVPIPACPHDDGGTYPAMSSQRINTAYSYGGVPCVAATVTALTGIPIDYAASLNMKAAEAMTDAIGGVEVCVAAPIRDSRSKLDIPAGLVRLDGDSAIAFLRTRYAVGDGSDLGRISNQQLFLAALLRQTRDSLSHIPTVYRLATAVSQHMSLSTNLQSIDTLASMALAVKDIDFDKIVFVQYPNGQNSAGDIVPATAAADALHHALLHDLPVELTGGTSAVGATVDETETSEDGTDVDDTGADGTDAGGSAGPGGTADSGDVPSNDTTVTLPDNTYGQTAAQETCATSR